MKSSKYKISFVLEKINQMPENESTWNYLNG